MQYVLRLLELSSDPPWLLQGRILPPSDLEPIHDLFWHQAICATYTLRLAILFDAPMDVQLDLLSTYWPIYHVGAGTVYGAEMAFLAGMILARSDPADPRLKVCYRDLELLALRCE
jgi:hypothetical protein